MNFKEKYPYGGIVGKAPKKKTLWKRICNLFGDPDLHKPFVFEYPTPTPRPKVNYLGDIKKVSLKPGDTLVLQTEVKLSDMDYARLAEQIKKQFPNNKCIVLECGMKLGVVENAK